jgi:hypothetical protein
MIGDNLRTDIDEGNTRGAMGTLSGAALAAFLAKHPEAAARGATRASEGAAAAGRAVAEGAKHPAGRVAAGAVLAGTGHPYLGWGVAGEALKDIISKRLARAVPEAATEAVPVAAPPVASPAAAAFDAVKRGASPAEVDAAFQAAKRAAAETAQGARASRPVEAPAAPPTVAPQAAPAPPRAPSLSDHPAILEAMRRGAPPSEIGDIFRAIQRGEGPGAAAPPAAVAPEAVPDNIAPGGWRKVGIENWYGTKEGPTAADWRKMGGAVAHRAWLESRNFIPGASTAQDAAAGVARGIPAEQIQRLYAEQRMPAAEPSRPGVVESEAKLNPPPQAAQPAAPPSPLQTQAEQITATVLDFHAKGMSKAQIADTIKNLHGLPRTAARQMVEMVLQAQGQ